MNISVHRRLARAQVKVEKGNDRAALRDLWWAVDHLSDDPAIMSSIADLAGTIRDRADGKLREDADLVAREARRAMGSPKLEPWMHTGTTGSAPGGGAARRGLVVGGITGLLLALLLLAMSSPEHHWDPGLSFEMLVLGALIGAVPGGVVGLLVDGSGRRTRAHGGVDAGSDGAPQAAPGDPGSALEQVDDDPPKTQAVLKPAGAVRDRPADVQRDDADLVAAPPSTFRPDAGSAVAAGSPPVIWTRLGGPGQAFVFGAVAGLVPTFLLVASAGEWGLWWLCVLGASIGGFFGFVVGAAVAGLAGRDR